MLMNIHMIEFGYHLHMALLIEHEPGNFYKLLDKK